MTSYFDSFGKLFMDNDENIICHALRRWIDPADNFRPPLQPETTDSSEKAKS
jgi:hypothetical protein